MKKDVTARRQKEKHGLKAFKKAYGAMARAGHKVPANRFKEALSQRKRLMEQLRKVDPENGLLAELEMLDQKPA
jgi:hypothetical protein